ncbi:unnamed protein product [Chironomus riparius]|uniref:Uncharacterized protein n=1 Tax=Chironomus riparius TaxID=315576 RepID=A0A9N9RT84_9DIPT|nr:unnamed protein product [Chironomus riparius]
MTLKKSKSSSKKASKIAEYKNIQDDIFDYAGRYHFHQTITDMLYAVYKEKSEDPYTFMINFLIETKGCKFKNNDNQKMLKEIQEKDVEIKRLNDRIAYLEGLNNHQNTQGSQLIGTQTFLNNVSLATTLTGLTDISVSDLEKFAEDPSFLQGFESHLKLPPQMAITSEENPMISNSDISVPVPTNENPAERQKTNDLILSFNYSRLTKSEPPENSKMSLETISSNDTDEIAMEVSDSELFEKPVIVKAPERNVKSINNFDDFEPDYEPDDDE